MTHDASRSESLERFRGYLRILAHGAMNAGLRSKRDTSDIVQDVYVKAYHALDDLRGTDDRQIAAWLKRILANVVIDENRHYFSPGGKRDVNREAAYRTELNDTSQRLEGLVSAKEQEVEYSRVLDLADALAQLNSNQREIIEQRYFQGKTLQQIAAETNLPRTTLARELRKAHEVLRGFLKDD